MSRSNAVVETVLASPAHRLLSGSLLLVRYVGTRSGREYRLPVQYADTQHGLVVVVGDPDRKTWWRNFLTMGQAQVLLRGRWVPVTAHALRGADDPDAVTPLLRAYAHRHPKVVKRLEGDTLDERVANAVVVWLRTVR
jgi:hypothetical protein